MGKLLKFENQKGLGKKKNFYIAVAVCLSAVCIASWSTYTKVKNNNTIEKNIVSENQHPSLDAKNREANKDLKGVTAQDNSSEQKSNTKNIYEKTDPAKSASNSVSEIIYPCASKEIIKSYSPDAPIYSKTFNDWRTHNGIDFATEDNEKIKSIATGKVIDIYDDPLLGKNIVIDHNGEFTAVYSGFAEILTQKDKTVEAGEEIGTTGEIPSEILDGQHLHLVIKKQGKIINPSDILK